MSNVIIRNGIVNGSKQIYMKEIFMKRSPILVYTCGVFDLFHIGHLNILQYAKGLGDKLIVGVSTDELVEQYKGKKTVDTFKERIAIVNALKCVDICIPQENRDKFDAWKKIGFDIWVVGDDWFGADYYMNVRERLAKVNVRSVFFPSTKGVNSTFRREQIKKA